MTYKVTVQAVTYHSYFLEDDDHDGDDYKWALSHTSAKMTEVFGWLAPGQASPDFDVSTAPVRREHGEWLENADGAMVWIADPEVEGAFM